MSLLWRLYASDRLIIKNGFLTINAYYSRSGKNAKDFDSFYLVKRDKPKKSKDQSKTNFYEGGPNWEIFNPNGNRFNLPNSLGLGWQNSNSTIQLNVDLHSLIDFYSMEPDKLHFSSKRCPTLVRKHLQEVFPIRKVSDEFNNVTVITLSYRKQREDEYDAKNFVIAAREVCKRLHRAGFWADFLNPFSGKPFYLTFINNKKLHQADKRFCGLGVKYVNRNNCMMISSERDGMFSGSIFTDATGDRDYLVATILVLGAPRSKRFDDDELLN